jgi:hypothetical protein
MMRKRLVLDFSQFFFEVHRHWPIWHKGSAVPASGSAILYMPKTPAGKRLLLPYQSDLGELTATPGWRALEDYCLARDLDLHLIDGFADKGGRRFGETVVFFPLEKMPPLRYVQIIITEHPSWWEALHLLDAAQPLIPLPISTNGASPPSLPGARG